MEKKFISGKFRRTDPDFSALRFLERSLVAIALVCLSSLSFAAVKNPDILVYAHQGEVTSLDPVYPYDAVSHGVIFNVYETLIRFKGSSLKEFEPLLSGKVPSVENGLISQDGLTYTFPIRKGIRFHDGTIMTPEDVRYSLLRFMLTDPAGGPASLLLEPIFGVPGTRDDSGQIRITSNDIRRSIKINGDKVIIRLKRPFAPFLSIMARWSYVMCKPWCVRNDEWNGTTAAWRDFNNRSKDKSYLFERMNGTGPFMLDRWDRNGKRIHLLRFENYWRKPARVKRVVLASISEFGTRRLMLEAGDADIIDLPRPFEAQIRGIKGIRVLDHLPRLVTDPVFFFTFKINSVSNPDIGSGVLDGSGIPPDFFSDPDVRKGFAYSFDYGAFLKESLKGKAKRARGPIPPGILGYDPEQTSYRHDLKKAARHFKKAWKGKVWKRGFKFTLTYNTGGEVRQLACEIMKKNVESINPKFRVNIRGLDWPSYLEKGQSRKMPLFTRGWTGDYPDPHNFIFPFYHSQGRYPVAQGYSNPRLDRLIEQAVAAADVLKRKSLYAQINKLAHDDAVQIYTVHTEGLSAQREWLKGFYDNAVFMGVYFYPLYK